MKRLLSISFLLVAVLVLWGGGAAGEGDPAGVAFDVKVVAGGSRGGPPATTWLATYAKGGKTAKFRITLPHKAAGSGTLRREEESDGSILLQDLGKELQGKVPAGVDRVDELTVTFVVLGEKMTKTEKGSFKGGGKGDWLAVKMFVAGDKAEFYLNINEKTGKGEIRMKDPEYGDAVMRELGRVL